MVKDAKADLAEVKKEFAEFAHDKGLHIGKLNKRLAEAEAGSQRHLRDALNEKAIEMDLRIKAEARIAAQEALLRDVAAELGRQCAYHEAECPCRTCGVAARITKLLDGGES
jgi:hypothetical protein